MKSTEIERTLCVYCGEIHYAKSGEQPRNLEHKSYIILGFDEPVCSRCEIKYRRLLKEGASYGKI